MNRTVLCAIFSLSALLAGSVLAQPSTRSLPAAPPPPQPSAPPNPAAVQTTAIDLGHRTWMLDSRGGNYTVVGNATVIVGDDGVILVDPQFAPLHDKVKEALAGLTDKPVRYVVDTHMHGDHSGGNQGFWLEGATIVAQENARRGMETGTTNVINGTKTPPAPQGALPNRTYSTKLTLSVGGRRVQLIHMPVSHTKGDTVVWIPDANVLATGDIVAWGNLFPNVDIGDGGSFDGVVKSIDAFLRMTNDKTRIVPGHGPVMTRADLVAYRAMVVDAMAAVRKAKATGMTEDQVVAAKPLAGDIQARFGGPDWIRDYSTRSLYRSVK